MTIPDHIAAARQRIANQIELDTARAKSDTRAEFRKLAEWINRSFGQRARWAEHRTNNRPAQCPADQKESLDYWRRFFAKRPDYPTFVCRLQET